MLTRRSRLLAMPPGMPRPGDPKRLTRGRLRDAAVCLGLAGALGCLGSGTARVDAPCREMRSAVAYEMLKENPSIPLLDVRAASEVTEREGRLARARQVPLETLAANLPDLDTYRDRTIVVFGVDGTSGRRACEFLATHGFRYVVFLIDGAPGLYGGGFERLPAFAVTPTPTATPVPMPPPALDSLPPLPTPTPPPPPDTAEDSPS